MRITVVPTTEEMGRRAAALIAEMKKKKKNGPFVLGLATGSTPIPLYKELIRMNKAGEIDFSDVITFNLDEYIGLDPTHSQSYRYFMNQQLFDHIDIKKENTHVPDGMAKDIEAHCEEYEAMIDKAGGIDCQVLGIGSNGHIGFNEPGSSLGSLTRIKTLTESTIEDNKRFFDSAEEVPCTAITMGIGTIMKARKVVLLASGKQKEDTIAKSAEGSITAKIPASVLQLHRWVSLIITKDCSGKLTLAYEQ